MKTASLLAALNIAKSSLGANDSVYPVLASFCFMGDFVYAYNDITAIIVEEKTGLTCALHGDTLLGVLAVAGTEDIAVTLSDGAANLKLKSGWVKIPAMDEKQFMFTPPNEEPIISIPFTNAVAEAIERCLISVSTDNVRQEFNGVSIRIKPTTGITFFSSDNSTALRYQPAEKFVGRKSLAAVIPQEACVQMLKLRKGDAVLDIGERFGTFTTDGVVLFTKLLPANIAVFEKVFTEHADDRPMFPLPEELARELAKARVVLQRETVQDCTLAFTKTELVVSASGVLGSMKATIKGEWNPGTVIITPENALRGMGHADHFALNDTRSIVFAGGPLTYLVSSKHVPPPAAAPAPPPTWKKPAAVVGATDSIEDDIPF